MRNCKSYKGVRLVDTLSLNIEDAFLTFKKGKPLDCDVVLSTDGISINKNSSTKFLCVRLDKTLNWKNILILYPVNYQEWHLRFLSLQLWWLVIFSLLCITPVHSHTCAIYLILGMGEWITVELEKAMIQKRKNRIFVGVDHQLTPTHFRNILFVKFTVSNKYLLGGFKFRYSSKKIPKFPNIYHGCFK